MKRKLVLIIAAVMIAVLTACGNNTTSPAPANNTTTPAPTNSDNAQTDHSGMNHSGSGEVPAGLKEDQNPKFKVGSQAIMQTEHMPGMKGATATIVGAYDTTAYAVSYTPTTGGDPVKNHKWVIHEELKNPGAEALKPGAQVTLEADHMPGMKGATGTIDSAEQTTVYMVDYTPTTGGEPVKNHKWVTDTELSPAGSGSQPNTGNSGGHDMSNMPGMKH
ncbi:YdhK family protein [Paenibacillus alginolyticus]|uniref:DUF1541 domain-containing protein n=1 Tax=Paenibacillus alginolyticus TaxID=59839 RepID=UPI0003FDF371|nr:YdhK family protein [Paenibacillus alginolyticus]MCY9668701.1 YdhK family protein [Paenibacillus alginolyticus]